MLACGGSGEAGSACYHAAIPANYRETVKLSKYTRHHRHHSNHRPQHGGKMSLQHQDGVVLGYLDGILTHPVLQSPVQSPVQTPVQTPVLVQSLYVGRSAPLWSAVGTVTGPSDLWDQGILS